MSLEETLRRYRPAGIDPYVSAAGSGSPAVQYAIACYLAKRVSPGSPRPEDRDLREAIRALRQSEGRAPIAWMVIDPSLEFLREPSSPMAVAFRRVTSEGGRTLERGYLWVIPSNPVCRSVVKITAEIEITPSTTYRPPDTDICVELGVGDEGTDVKDWKGWKPLRYSGPRGRSGARYEASWRPPKLRRYWILVRCRVGKHPWTYIDSRGFRAEQAASISPLSPELVTVRRLPRKPSRNGERSRPAAWEAPGL